MKRAPLARGNLDKQIEQAILEAPPEFVPLMVAKYSEYRREKRDWHFNCALLLSETIVGGNYGRP